MAQDPKNLEVYHAEQTLGIPALPAIDQSEIEYAPRGVAAEVSDKAAVDVVDVVLNRIDEDDMIAVSASCMKLRSPTGWRIAGILLVMGLNQAGYGIDWAVIGSINSYPTWHAYFNFPNDGPVLGTLNALMSIGGFVGAPFLLFSDVYGRRSVNFIGNFIVVIAAIMQSQAPNIGVFMVGRFLLGFGTSMCTSSQYMAEIAPVHLRGRLVGIFGACFQIGAVLMGGAMVGFSRWTTSDWQWRCPLLLQAVPGILVCASIYFLCPETPRYLIMKGRHEEARRVIAKHMTSNNDINAPIVPLMVRQIEESLQTATSGVKTFRAAWDFRSFLTRRVAYRTMILVLYSLFQSWNGGGIISTYLSPALDTIGITSSLSQTGLNLGLTAIYFVFTAFGSYLIDIMRRRSLLYAGLISCILTQIAVTITSWRYTVTPSTPLAALTVLWVFMYQILSASFIATLHNLYPVEILSLPLRAKGMALYSLVQSAAGVVQTYGISVGISKLGYKIWVVYIVYNSIQLVLVKFLFPETSKLSLEDIDYIFETPGEHPVKLSLRLEKARKEREAAARGPD
jgi:MFS family permease